MAKTQKIIISCAITGAIHTPSMSPYLPVTPDQIAEASIGAAKAGAAIVHLHARNPETGKPDHSLAAFAAFLLQIKRSTDAVVNLTSGGSPYMGIEERIQPAVAFMPELASLNMGSMNFGLFPALERFSEFRHSWERDYLESSRDLVFRNTFKDVEYALRTCDGRNQLPTAAVAAAMGGNVRVGLEDSLWIGPGELATSNAAQVHRVRQIIESLGYEVATPADAREILSLKGGDKVAF
jgi:uncharacterized protein (DUF849 family)